MAKAATLTVDVVADPTGLDRGFDQATQRADQFKQRLDTVATGISDKLTGLSGAVGQVGQTLERFGVTGAGSAISTVTSALDLAATNAGRVSSAVAGLEVGIGTIATRFLTWGTAIGVLIAGLQAAGLGISSVGEAQASLDNATRAHQESLATFNATLDGTASAADRAAVALRNAELAQVRLNAELRLGRVFEDRSRAITQNAQATVTIDEQNRAIANQLELYQRMGENPNGSLAIGRSFAAIEQARRVQQQTRDRLDELDREQRDILADPRLRLGQTTENAGRILSSSPFGPPAPEARSGGGVAARADNVDREAQAVERLVEGYRRLGDPTREVVLQQQQLNVLYDNGLLSTREYEQATAALDRRFLELSRGAQQLEQPLTETQQAILSFGKDISKSLVDALLSGEAAFDDFVVNIGKKILEFLTYVSIVRPILQGLFGQGGMLSDFLPSFSFGGGRATGGSVVPGVSYRVGEFGPETFVPDQPGRIVPGGSGGVTVNVINQAGADVQTEQREGPNGPEVDIYILRVVSQGIAQGSFDRQLRNGFNLRRAGIP